MTCASPDEFPAPTCDCPACTEAFDREYAEPELTPAPERSRPLRFASGGVVRAARRKPHIEELERTTDHDRLAPGITATRTRIRYDDGSIRTYTGTPPPFPHTLTEPDPPPPAHVKARLRAGEFVLTPEDAKRLLDAHLTFTDPDPSAELIGTMTGLSTLPPPTLPCGHATPTLCTDYCFPEPPNPNAPF